MIPRISIKLALYTEFGPCGYRLERLASLPVDKFAFEDTPQGRVEAEEAREKMQGYCEKYHK